MTLYYLSQDRVDRAFAILEWRASVNGCCPSNAELAAACGLDIATSGGVVAGCLEQRGYIKRQSIGRTRRRITLLVGSQIGKSLSTPFNKFPGKQRPPRTGPVGCFTVDEWVAAGGEITRGATMFCAPSNQASLGGVPVRKRAAR